MGSELYNSSNRVASSLTVVPSFGRTCAPPFKHPKKILYWNGVYALKLKLKVSYYFYIPEGQAITSTY